MVEFVSLVRHLGTTLMATRSKQDIAVATSPSAVPDDALPRRLGLLAATAIVIGTIIGSGIFRVPAAVAGAVGTPSLVAVVWVVGGLITLCGALSLSELAAAYPRTGGVFVYLREAYGPLIAFLFGWTMLFLAPGALGGIALVFAEYLGTLISLSPTAVRVAASVTLLGCGVLGYRSVTGVAGLVSVATFAKVGAIMALVFVAFVMGDSSVGSFGAGAPQAGDAQWSGIGLGLVAALWAYNGFQDMVSVAGEVRDPARVLPRALISGLLIVVVVYLAANAAYLYVLPFDALRTSTLVASDTMVRVVGAGGAAAVAAMVMTSTFGAVVGITLLYPRIFFAMARAGLLFKALARVHPKFRTPHIAVAVQTVVAIASAWSRSFEQLTAAFVLGLWPFLALAAMAVIILRRKHPDLHRPYRTPGYPVVPLLFVAGTLWVIGSSLVANPKSTVAGMLLTLLGVPIYLVRQRLDRSDRSADPQ
jgi:basic amino acid/polyamine antiporter, APA family